MKSIATALVVVAGIIALESGAAQANTPISREADVRGCELYVDDLSLQDSGRQGNWKSELVVNLTARSGLEVTAVGGYLRYHESTAVEQYDDAGKLIGTRRDQGIRERMIAAPRSHDGRYKLVLPTRWSVYGRDVGERELLDFAFYVEAAADGVVTRFWLKNGDVNFAGTDISADRYYYSQGVFLGGYTTAKYLWRDSGSPVFHNRQGCLGR